MRGSKLLIVVTLGALLVGLFAGGLYVRSTAVGLQNPSDGSAEAGFARDMGTHHQQAVEMSFTIREKSTDPAVRQLAFDVINTQATQRGMMMGWLQQWGLPQTSSRPAMAWMDNGKSSGMDMSSGDSSMNMDSSGLMPGMATQQELAKLDKLGGKTADILYMQLMIRHHTAGIAMAKGLLAQSDRPEVRNLANTIVSGQQAEIDALKQMLQERGAAP